MSHGYRIDHIPVTARCCELHNVNCEPQGDLCCDDCAEIDHNHSLTGERDHPVCVLDPCICTSEQQHVGTTQPGYAGAPIGMREPLELTW